MLLRRPRESLVNQLTSHARGKSPCAAACNPLRRDQSLCHASRHKDLSVPNVGTGKNVSFCLQKFAATKVFIGVCISSHWVSSRNGHLVEICTNWPHKIRHRIFAFIGLTGWEQYVRVQSVYSGMRLICGRPSTTSCILRLSLRTKIGAFLLLSQKREPAKSDSRRCGSKIARLVKRNRFRREKKRCLEF